LGRRLPNSADVTFSLAHGWRVFSSPPTLGFNFRTVRYCGFDVICSIGISHISQDNVCDPAQPSNGVSGTYLNVNVAGEIIPTITVTQDTTVVACSQNWRELDAGFPFPPVPSLQGATKWMKGSQEDLTRIYGYSALAALVGFIVLFFGAAITRFLLSWFKGVSEPETQDQMIDFSCNEGIDAYVPQIKRVGVPFPYLCCDIDQMDKVSGIMCAQNNTSFVSSRR
jgi:hypothetical protein